MKRRFSAIICVLLCAMMVLCAARCDDSNTSYGRRTPVSKGDIDDIDDGGDDDVTIVKSESSKVKYKKFDNGLVSLDIPSGWKVEVAPADYIHYSFKVFNPKDKDYMFLFGLKQEGFLKSEEARKTYASYYPDAMFSKLAAVTLTLFVLL